jgi:hypothetical protein
MGIAVRRGIMSNMNPITAVGEMKPNHVDVELHERSGKALALPGMRGKFEFWSLLGKIKSWLAARRDGLIPAGYEDECGFHYGVQPRREAPEQSE